MAGFWSALFSSASAGVAGKPRTAKPRTPRPPSVAATSVDDKLRRSSSGIDYRLQRVRRKSIGLVITTDGLLIRAPNWTPLYEIDAAISERRAWIAKALERQSARREQLAAYRDGGHILFRGRKLKVELRDGLFESIDLTDEHCIVTTTSGSFNPTVLDDHIKRIAQPELTEIAVDMAARAGLPLKSVTLSSARTLWGSCTSDGRVRLNFRLMQLAPELMRHVVAHELAHLVEFNHSKRFWAIVEALDPDTRLHKRLIKGYAVLLEL
jgi:predicted metal-dependent hydrolase